MSSRHTEDPKKTRGRPPTYVWKSDDVLSDAERRLKIAIEKRRERQKKSYYKKKSAKQREAQAVPSGAAIPDCLLDDYSTPSGHRKPQKPAGSSSASKRSSQGNSPLVVVREYYGYP